MSALRPEAVRARIEIAVSPATARQHRSAMPAVKRLDRPFFRSHSCLACYYQQWITRQWLQLLVWPLGWLAVPDVATPENHPARRVAASF